MKTWTIDLNQEEMANLAFLSLREGKSVSEILKRIILAESKRKLDSSENSENPELDSMVESFFQPKKRIWVRK